MFIGLKILSSISYQNIGKMLYRRNTTNITLPLCKHFLGSAAHVVSVVITSSHQF